MCITVHRRFKIVLYRRFGFGMKLIINSGRVIRIRWVFFNSNEWLMFASLTVQTILDPSFSQVEKKGLIRGNLSLSIFHTLGLQIKMKMKIGNNALNMLITRRLKLIPAMKKIMSIDHGRHINTKIRMTLNLQFGRLIYD